MKKWLDGMPTAALVVVTGCTLALLTWGVFAVQVFRGKPFDEAAWALWLGFVSAVMGVYYLSFSKKRETESPDIIAAHAAASKVRTQAAADASPPLTPKEATAIATSSEGE